MSLLEGKGGYDRHLMYFIIQRCNRFSIIKSLLFLRYGGGGGGKGSNTSLRKRQGSQAAWASRNFLISSNLQIGGSII